MNNTAIFSGPEFWAVLTAVSVVVLVTFLLIAIPQIIIFRKAGRGGWEPFIPVYQTYVFAKIIGRNPWVVLLIIYGGGAIGSLIPFIGILLGLVPFAVGLMMMYEIAIVMGHSTIVGVLNVLFPPITGWYIALSKKSQYMGPLSGGDRRVFMEPPFIDPDLDPYAQANGAQAYGMNPYAATYAQPGMAQPGMAQPGVNPYAQAPAGGPVMTNTASEWSAPVTTSVPGTPTPDYGQAGGMPHGMTPPGVGPNAEVTLPPTPPAMPPMGAPTGMGAPAAPNAPTSWEVPSQDAPVNPPAPTWESAPVADHPFQNPQDGTAPQASEPGMPPLAPPPPSQGQGSTNPFD